MTPFAEGVAANAVGLGFGLVNNAVSGLINNAFYKRNLGLQVQAQKDLINYQNEYNSPTAQMQRLQEAGLNPNLVYGSAAPAGVSGNAAAPAGGGLPGSFGTHDIAASAAHMAQMHLASSAEELNIANADKARAEAELTKMNTRYYPEVIEMTIKKGYQEIDTLASQKDLNISKAKEAEAKAILNQAEAALKAGELSLIEYRRQEIIANTALLLEKKNTEKALQNYHNEAAATQAQLGNYYYYEAAVAEIEARWNSIVKSEGNAEKAAEAMRASLVKEAAEAGVQGKKGIIWVNTIMNWLTGVARSAGDIGGTAGLIKVLK